MRPKHAWTFGVARGGALFLTGLIAFNLVGEFVREGFDANGWWIGLGARDSTPASVTIAVAGVLLGAWAVRPAAGVARRAATVGALAALVTLAILDTVVAIVMNSRMAVDTGGVPPFSAWVALGLAWILAQVARVPLGGSASPADTEPAPAHGSWKTMLVTAGACVVAFPCAQMVCFGKSDHRRPADVAVVFGCRTYVDGTPSNALADRVRTACELYHQDFVDRLLVSGGPGDGDVHETESMRRLAVSLGVPDEAILVDPGGTSTQATVDGTCALLRSTGMRRVLAVSHDYHLPRIKLAYQRAGLEVFTVPAHETTPLRDKPWNLGREVVASWYYFVRPLAESP